MNTSECDEYELYVEEYADLSDTVRTINKKLSGVNLILQLITFMLTLFHLLIITRSEMRKLPVNILMIGICLSDLSNMWVSFFTAVSEYYPLPPIIDTLLPPPPTVCWSLTLYQYQILELITEVAKGTFRYPSVYLSVLMSFYRTLSVMFPMSSTLQKLSTARCAVITVIGMIVFWFLFSTYHLVHVRVMTYETYCSYWAPWQNLKTDSESTKSVLSIFKKSKNSHNGKNQKIARRTLKTLPLIQRDQYFDTYHNKYLLTIPSDISRLQNNMLIEGLNRSFPAVCYPIATIFLIFKIKEIHTKRASLNKESGRNRGSTTRLIFWMTVSFALSEGIAGLVRTFQFFTNQEEGGLSLFRLFLRSNEGLITVLRTVNTSLHPVFCLLMSSQYKDTVRDLFCCRSKLKIIQVDAVEATSCKT